MELQYTNRKGEIFTILYDACDHELISKYRWCISRGYAMATRYVNGVSRNVTMHRLILGLTDPKIHTDHVNHNGLDNRRINIRPCTRAQNMQNVSAYGKSKYLGVCYNKSGNNWYIKAQIKVNRINIHLGNFPTEELAAKAYDRAAKLYFKEFANLNFPDEWESFESRFSELKRELETI